MTADAYVERAREAFAMWCDENGVTLTAGIALAERMADQLMDVAESRVEYLPPELCGDE